MSPAVLGFVVSAAFAHAGWNVLAKQAGGGALFVWSSVTAGVVVYLPLVVVVGGSDAGSAPLGWAAIWAMVGSGVLHASYFVLLQRGYATGDLSLVYPLARGTGPLLSTLAAIALLGERPGLLALAGSATVVAAILSLTRRSSAELRRASEGIVFALLTGLTIAAYTLWDKHAVDQAQLAPIAYFWGSLGVSMLLLAPWAMRNRRTLRSIVVTSWARALGVGLLSPLAYVLILYALSRASVSYVAPAREISIVVGTLFGVFALKEGDAQRRLLAATGIVLGVAALALG